MAEKISGIYKITNTATGDFYIGSSKNIKRRWTKHRCPSSWNEHPNNPLYLDMQKYGVEKFEFQVIAEAEIEHLKESEQQFIEKLKPTYNNYRAKGRDIERHKESNRKANKKYYQQNREIKKERQNKYQNGYDNQLCSYNGEVLKLCALSARFRRAGIEHPTKEAKKYLV